MQWHDKSPKPRRFAQQQLEGIRAFRPGLTILSLALLSTLDIGIHLLAAARPGELYGQPGGNAPPASLVGIIREATRRYLHLDAARAARARLA